MGRFGRGMLLVRASWRVLMGDKKLFLFTLVGGVCTLLAAATFVLPARSLELAREASAVSGGPGVTLNELVFVFGFYLVTSFITLFFNTALVSVALLQMRGADATVSDGFKHAVDNIDRIFLYALISATVGLLLSQLERMRLIGRIVGSILGAAWSVVTFLVVPIIVAEGCGPVTAIVRSGALLRKTWGEQLSGETGMGLVFTLLSVPALVPFVFAVTSDTASARISGIAIAAAYLAILALVASALGQIFRVAVYIYATTGVAPSAFDQSVFEGAFTREPSRWAGY